MSLGSEWRCAGQVGARSASCKTDRDCVRVRFRSENTAKVERNMREMMRTARFSGVSWPLCVFPSQSWALVGILSDMNMKDVCGMGGEVEESTISVPFKLSSAYTNHIEVSLES